MSSRLVRFASLLERMSCSFAHHVITVNDARRAVLEGRGIPQEKITVIMNSPDEKVFVKKNIDDFKERLDLHDKFITVYVGGINPERNLEVIIRAMSLVKNDIPSIYFLLFGHYYGQEGSGYVDDLKSLAKELGLEDSVYFGGELRGEDVASYMDLADFGVVSYLANPMTELAMPNKVFEYAALDIPIISCRVKGIHSLLGEEAALYFESENEKELAQRIKWLHGNRSEITAMIEAARRIYSGHTWNIMKERLQGMYG
jgi:glycosyltransferase involved in cell wall biosynthesis